MKFGGRIPERVVYETYMVFDFTVHLAKPSYCKTGFVTARWAEAAAAATYGFIPGEFHPVPRSLKRFIVNDGHDLFNKATTMSEDEWYEGVHIMQLWVAEHMIVDPWLKLFEEAANVKAN
jgi:hypothetical protein